MQALSWESSMAIHVSWGSDAKTYTCFKYVDNWTWQEYYRSISEASELIKDVPYTVNTVLDLSEAQLLPHGLLSNIQSSMRQPPRKFDLAVIVSTSAFVKVLTNMIDRIYGQQGTHFIICKTREEADRIMAEHDKAHTA
jgi:hypothetical protein